jgi:hypothetical protein
VYRSLHTGITEIMHAQSGFRTHCSSRTARSCMARKCGVLRSQHCWCMLLNGKRHSRQLQNVTFEHNPGSLKQFCMCSCATCMKCMVTVPLCLCAAWLCVWEAAREWINDWQIM